MIVVSNTGVVTPFERLKVGDVFVTGHGYFMKILPCMIDGEHRDAVHLHNGYLSAVCGATLVNKVNGRFMVD